MCSPLACADNEDMNKPRLTLSTALVTSVVGATFVVSTAPVSAGGFPPTLNCLANVCTVLHGDAQDSDGDGFTDADEELFGSDPDDPNSCPPVRWLFDRIADTTLPSIWLKPMIDLVTISPDGRVVTATLLDAMTSLGLKLPAKANNFGLTMAPAGVDLGTIGGTLDWQIHGESSSKNPPPPDAPNASLYGFTGGPPSSASVSIDGKGTAYVQNSFVFGEATSKVQITDSDGKRMGEGTATGKDPWATQAEATKKASERATEEAAARIAAAVEAETKRLADEADQREAAQAAAEKAAKEQAAADAAAKKAADAAAAAKAAEEARTKGEKDHATGGLTDPDAGTPIDPRFLSAAQVAALVAAGSGSYFSNVGDTGVMAMMTPGTYKDPTMFIIHIDPTADPSSEGGASSTPVTGGKAGPRYDPNHPTPGTTGGIVRPPGEPPR